LLVLSVGFSQHLFCVLTRLCSSRQFNDYLQ